MMHRGPQLETILQKHPEFKDVYDKHLQDIFTSKEQKRLSDMPKCPFRGAVTEKTWPPPEGLGDYISDGLAAIGITKERWSQLVTLGKSKSGCGCNARQKLANWLGEQLGFEKGREPELHELLRKTDVPIMRLHICSLHGECLPQQSLTGLQELASMEGVPRMCMFCKDNPKIKS